jgi:hypothetical protein
LPTTRASFSPNPELCCEKSPNAKSSSANSSINSGGTEKGKFAGVANPRWKASKKVQEWLKARYMKELFQVQIRQSEYWPKLTYRFDNRAWERLQTTTTGAMWISSGVIAVSTVWRPPFSA